MSILNATDEPVQPADRIARGMKQQVRATFQHLVHTFNQGSQNFWRNTEATPTEIAAALGTDAKEVFELHGKIGALLASIKPEEIADGASVVGLFEYNTDGTITITESSPPADA